MSELGETFQIVKSALSLCSPSPKVFLTLGISFSRLCGCFYPCPFQKWE